MDSLSLPHIHSQLKSKIGCLLPAVVGVGIESSITAHQWEPALVWASLLCLLFGSSLLDDQTVDSDTQPSRQRHVIWNSLPTSRGIRAFFRSVLEGRDTRRILMFLTLNLMFTAVEALYGYFTNSLSLISDASHMLFDCTALAIGLYAAYMSKWRATQTFSYGYGRFEVLSGFVNGVFLVVIAFLVLVEALERLFDPPEINTNQLLLVSVCGFCVNMVGIVFFHEHHTHAHSHGGGECALSGDSSDSHGHAHAANFNMQGIFLHILADTLGSLGVIVSCLVIEWWKWYIIDPLCSLIISVLIVASVIPLLRQSAQTLLQRAPEYMEHSLEEALIDVKRVDGVVSCQRPHFWTFVNDEVVGTLHVSINESADPQVVLKNVSLLLANRGVRKTTVQVQVTRER
eukprot:c7035_g1_i1.p1 GENE.c7035_g1_i1~~c7035_g1_i1.p1  ORF type:complete len:401 (-),score=88.40 c7035_g1_i1:50-1252(-)